jgi:hypothetical protein
MPRVLGDFGPVSTILLRVTFGEMIGDEGNPKIDSTWGGGGYIRDCVESGRAVAAGCSGRGSFLHVGSPREAISVSHARGPMQGIEMGGVSIRGEWPLDVSVISGGG